MKNSPILPIEQNQQSEPPLIQTLMFIKNGAQTIGRALDSLFSQSYQNFKVTIQDGVSTDGTLEIIAEYQQKYPNYIDLISESDRSITEAIARLLRRVDGDWFHFLLVSL